MKYFLLSLKSEFFKSKNTLAFWGAILLPVILCTVVFLGYYLKSEAIIKAMKNPSGEQVWGEYLFAILAVMGSLLLPMYLIFMTYTVNNLEHKAETWKSLFSLPVPKNTIYFSKAFYTIILVFISLLLFVILSVGYGLLLAKLKPDYHLMDADFVKIFTMLSKIYIKLYIASLGIIAVQFLLSLIWSDFMKPMGLGFVLLVVSMIVLRWDYSYLIPYSLPIKAIAISGKEVLIVSKEMWVSLCYAVVFFSLGYFVITKKSVK